MRAWLEVDLSVIAANYDVVKRYVGPSTGIYAVVKSDAYGHGIDQIARLLDSKGAAGFAVIALEEAIAVRRVSNKPVLILGYLDDSEIEEAIVQGFCLSLYDLELAPLIDSIAARRGVRAQVHLKVETGLNRLGLEFEDADWLLSNMDRYPRLELVSLYTHLSTSSDRGEDLVQLARFLPLAQRARAQGHDLKFHMANSHALRNLPEGFFDFVRVGLALYGVEEVLPGLRPALQCKTVVIQRKRVRKGQGVSYNKLFRADKDLDVAIISIGYAEGLSQALTGKAYVLLNGHKTPILGQICMNLCVVSAEGIPAKRGDEVVVIGTQAAADGSEISVLVPDMAKAAGLRHHEIITRLGKSLPRVYSCSTAACAVEMSR